MVTETFEAAEETHSEEWDFAGWGDATRIKGLPDKAEPESKGHKKLGVWSATAICGNDITSSCLYVSALCAVHAGVLAPLVLLIVAGVLYLFRKVYAEVGSALPLNGGCYTALLNTTNKRIAATAACLTILSYVATAVISAGEAMHYAHHLWDGLNVFNATIGLLCGFAFLNLMGISESARVAVVIFVFHMLTLTVLVVTGIYAVITAPELFMANWRLPSSEGLMHALFFGFAAAMLGISGFESSANFIEEQKPGVFPKTLRNMWVAVAIFNPLISLLSLGLLPLASIQEVPPDMLAEMGTQSVGAWLGLWVSVDAVLVLSGAVLTSFVGVTGLMRRMALDRCLPQFFLRTNRWRKTNHWILLAFTLICTTILFITSGEIKTLAGVYTLSFLCVMALFAIGNMLLKLRRAKIPRDTRASWPTVSVALLAVVLGLIGNIIMDPLNVEIFVAYFIAVGAIVAVMFLRVPILKVILFIVRSVLEKMNALNSKISGFVIREVNAINDNAMVYFTREDDPATLNRAILYVLQNEQTNRLKVIHVYTGEEPQGPLAKDLTRLDRLYPELRIDFIAVEGTFGPGLIDSLAKHLGVPKNQMFISTPGESFAHRLEELGGVRVIL